MRRTGRRWPRSTPRTRSSRGRASGRPDRRARGDPRQLPRPPAARAAARHRQRRGRGRGRRPCARVQRDRALSGRSAPEGGLPEMSAKSPLIGTFTDKLVRTRRRLALRRAGRRARLQPVAFLATACTASARGTSRASSDAGSAGTAAAREERLRRRPRRRASPRPAAVRRRRRAAPPARPSRPPRTAAARGTGRRPAPGSTMPPGIGAADADHQQQRPARRIGRGQADRGEARGHRAEQQHQRGPLAPAVDQHARADADGEPGEIGDAGDPRGIVEREPACGSTVGSQELSR